jgi:tetratricopeptide (TPR) repeat protein
MTREQLESLATIGFNLYQEGKLDEAKPVFEGIRLTAPESFYGYAGLGCIALITDPPEVDAAISNLTRAVELNPESPTLHANLGEALLRNRQLAESSAEFRKAIELDPDKKDAGANRARAIIEGLSIALSELKRMAPEPTHTGE